MNRNLLIGSLAAASVVLVGVWLLRRVEVSAVPRAEIARGPSPVPVPEAALTRAPAAPTPAADPEPAGNESASDDGRLGIEDVAKRLAALGDWKDRHDLLRVVNRRWGTAGLLRVFDDWIALLGDEKTPERGPLHAWRSATRYHSGDPDGAMKDIVELVPAMDVSWAKDEDPYPLLLAFASGYNAGIHAAPEARAWAATGMGFVASGGGMLGPETNSTGVLPFGEREAYVRWVLDLADSAGEPEVAMAASIWGHALSLWCPGMKDGLPPAAHRLMERLLPHEAQERFSRAVERGVEEKDGAALRYREWVARGDALRERTSGRSPTWMRWYDPICWSLHEEVVVRFAAADSEKARALRALAAKLLE